MKIPSYGQKRELQLHRNHSRRVITADPDQVAPLGERFTALPKTMGRFHRYSFHNLCLITIQCPTATRVAGFQAWRTMGRFVRKGEKGIAIRELEAEAVAFVVGEAVRLLRSRRIGFSVRRP